MGTAIAPRKNDASEAQMQFVEQLLAQCEITADPIDYLFRNATKPRRRKGYLSKDEASKLITSLKIQTRSVMVDAPAWSVEKINAWCENNWSQSSIERLVASERAGLGAFLKEWASNQTGNRWCDELAAAHTVATSALVYGVYSEYRDAWSIDRKAQAVAKAAKEAGTDTAETPATPAVLREIPKGVHVVVGYTDDEDYTLFRVRESYAKRTYALQFDRAAADRCGSPVWNYVNTEPLTELSELTMLDFQTAKEFGDLYGFCLRCDRALTDEKSVEYGIGPVCRKNMRLDGARETRS